MRERWPDLSILTVPGAGQAVLRRGTFIADLYLLHLAGMIRSRPGDANRDGAERRRSGRSLLTTGEAPVSVLPPYGS
jgi:hypothetical protein